MKLSGKAGGVWVLILVPLVIGVELAGIFLLPRSSRLTPLLWILPLALLVVTGLALSMRIHLSEDSSESKRIRFFNSLARRWKKSDRTTRLWTQLDHDLASFGINPGESMVDIGCGTGVLVGCLLNHLGPEGRVHAVDIAPEMLACAERQYRDDRVRFVLAHAENLPMEQESTDRCLLFSVWPHIQDKEAALKEFSRILRPGGRLHIWHHNSRATINRIHREAHPSVSGDQLEPSHELAERLLKAGFLLQAQMEEGEYYMVTAEKPA